MQKRPLSFGAGIAPAVDQSPSSARASIALKRSNEGDAAKRVGTSAVAIGLILGVAWWAHKRRML